MQKLITIGLTMSLFIALAGHKSLSGAGLSTNAVWSIGHNRVSDSNYNWLTLNGATFNYANFSLSSHGKLVMMATDPTSRNVTKVPFRIYLQRNGQIIQQGASDKNRQVAEIDVASVLGLARSGDELVIEPIHQSAKRIIRLHSWMPINWLHTKQSNKDC